MRMLGQIYQWLWFHSEFLVTPTNRRPWTFCARDWIYTHVSIFICVLIVWFGGVLAWNLFHPVPASIIGFLSAFVLAHLVFGSAWIEGQQEFPEYLG